MRWMAPEIVNETEPTATLASDIWAYGVAMWEIYSKGSIPFYDGLLRY